MGVSVGFGVGPVRVSKRIGGGGRRGSSGPGFFSMLSEMGKEMEKARIAEKKATAAARYESAARRVANGSLEPQVVIDFLEGKARHSRSTERQQFMRNQAVMIRSGHEFEVKTSPSGTVTVKVLDSKRPPTIGATDQIGATVPVQPASHVEIPVHAARPAAPLPNATTAPSAGPVRLAGQPRSVSVALGLALLLGVYGGHRFYLGYHKEGAIQMFTAGGFFVWLIMDISDIVAGRMTDVHGRPLVGEPRSVLRFLWQVVTLIVAVVGLLTGIGGAGMLLQGDPEGMVAIIAGVTLTSGALLLAYAERRKASATRKQQQAEARASRIDALERQLGITN